MHQVATSLIFAAAAAISISTIVIMLKQNGAAILSALAGHGAFPAPTSPEKGPSAHVVYVARPSRRTAQRVSRFTNRAEPMVGISYAA